MRRVACGFVIPGRAAFACPAQPPDCSSDATGRASVVARDHKAGAMAAGASKEVDGTP